MPPTIVICATERCGSTLLCEDMRATGALGLPNEYFIPLLETVPPEDWLDRLAEVRQKFSSRNGVFAVKVMASYLPAIDERYAAAGGASRAQDRPHPHFLAAFPDAHWVWIRRRDIIEQAVSREFARQTGVTHAVDDADRPFFLRKGLIRHEADYNRDAVVDHDAIIAEIGRIERETASWQTLFDAWGISPLVITYEDIVEPGRGHLRAIADHCGIALGDWTMERRLKKLANERSRAAYLEVLKRLGAAGKPAGCEP